MRVVEIIILVYNVIDIFERRRLGFIKCVEIYWYIIVIIL